MSSKTHENGEQDIDWVQLRKDMDSIRVETIQEKFERKFKENPFVPIGCVATAGVLLYGLWCFRLGRTRMSQYMMRARIAAQGFTVAALIVGIGISANNVSKQNE
ncbi:HIG1 domain family member 2A, mitochondrial [Bacillus rossius redtenbacheri]|uniref:HIG1 domain family member 2A, mitochondrial n=1 Tax=Bacillus rossius redtenbacheri TaxID=93214 RepID=UPI002FDDEAAE